MRQERRVLISIAVALTLVGTVAAAQRPSRASDAEIVGRATLAATGDHVEIFADGVTISPAFVPIVEAAYRRLEALTGRGLDTATLGPKIRIYVSDAVTISHVWRGYEHPRDPKGIVLLNQRVYQAALTGADAAYAHEMAHLFTWRYRSHTLREGLADYLALQIHPGAGVGPNPNGYAASGRIPAQIVDHLGTARPAPAWLATDMSYRRAYYYASYRFVKSLVETAGMEVFLQLYDATDPETEIVRLYGATREELIRRAGM